MRGRIGAGAWGLGCAGLLVLTLVTPAAGERNNAPGPCSQRCGTPAGGVAADCEDASMNTPPGGGSDLRLTADVPDGATVGPGEDILLRLTWDKARWSDPDLDRALHCVRVKGALDPDLSAEEAPTANDGVYEYRLHVPDDIRPGCDICVQGFVAGDGDGGGPQQARSDRHCFMSGPPGPPPTRPTPPATRPPAPPVIQPPPTTPATAAVPPPRAPAEVPTDVGGITASQPGSKPGTEVAPGGELPRTGAASSRAGTAGGGLALTLGGFALMGGSGRRNRRRTGV